MKGELFILNNSINLVLPNNSKKVLQESKTTHIVKSGESLNELAFLYKVNAKDIADLNNIIDYNFYPTSKTRVSNFKHRPIGIGVQGLANLFYLLLFNR